MPAFPVSRHRLALLAGTVALLPATAPAQDLTPKIVWSLLAQTAAESGGTLTVRTTRTEDNTIIFTDIAATVEREVHLAIPELRMTRMGTSLRVAMTQPAEVRVQDGPGDEVLVRVTADGDATFSLSPESAIAVLDFTRIGAELSQPARQDLSPIASGSFSIDGVRANLNADLTAPHDGTLTLAVGAVDYNFSFAEARPNIFSLATRGSLDRFEVMGTTRGFPGPDSHASMREAFTNGFTFDSAVRLSGLDLSFEQDERGRPMRIQTNLGNLDINFSMDRGLIVLTTALNALAADMASGFFTGGGALQELSARMVLPALASPDLADVAFSYNLSGLTLSDQILASVGAQSFSGDAASVSSDVRMQVVVTRDLDLDELDDSSPFDPRRITGSLGASLGAAALTADFDVEPAPGALQRLGDAPPEVTGRVNVDLRGGQAFVRRLADAGILPGEQAFMAASVLGALGRAVGDDHLVSEVELRPGGAVFVNGAPAPF